MEVKKYAYIDALRGIAILAVLLVHSGQGAVATSGTLNWLMQNGARGVQFFYIASAITLCMSWDARGNIERFPKIDFYLRRFFRIAPMFYLAIVLYLLIDGFAARYWAPNGVQSWYVLVTVLFLHGFNPETINSVVPGGWSIAVEMTFYALFPFVVTKLRSYGAFFAFFIASLVFLKNDYGISSRLFFYPENQNYLVGNFAFLNFLGQFPVFLVGMFSYMYIKNGVNKAVFYLVGGCLFIALCLEYYSPKITQPFMPDYVVAGIAFALFAVFLSVNPLKIFVNFASVHLGRLSYSMYLLHFAVLHLFGKLGLSAMLSGSNWGSLLHFALLVCLSGTLAHLTLVLIEKPGIRLGSWCIQKINARDFQGTKNH